MNIDPCVLCQLSPCQCRPLHKKGVAHMTPEEASKIEHRLNEQFAYLQHIDTMPAGPELDRLVCKAVGIEPLPGLYEQEIVRIDGKAYSDGPMVPIYPPVSTKPGPAMEVVEKVVSQRLCLHHELFELSYDGLWWYAWFYNCYCGDEELEEFTATGETKELAICRAAYKLGKGKS